MTFTIRIVSICDYNIIYKLEAHCTCAVLVPDCSLHVECIVYNKDKINIGAKLSPNLILPTARVTLQEAAGGKRKRLLNVFLLNFSILICLLINLDVHPSLISFLFAVHSSFGLGAEGNSSYDGVP